MPRKEASRCVGSPSVMRGMSHAINKGLRMANGEILAYLNSDDLYLPWTLNVVVKALDTILKRISSLGMLCAIDDVSGERQVYLFPPFHLDQLAQGQLLAQPGGAVVAPRSVAVLGRLDESLGYVADCDLSMRLAGSSLPQGVRIPGGRAHRLRRWWSPPREGCGGFDDVVHRYV